MINDQMIKDTRYNVRTQISLSRSLYTAIKNRARREGKSIARVLREAYRVYEQQDEGERTKRQKWLEKWVARTRGMSKGKRGGWGDPLIAHKLIRKEREEEDAVLAKRSGWGR